MDIKIDKPPNKNEGGVLALLWRKILLENNFMPAMGMLINRYLRSYDTTDGRVSNMKKKNRSTLITNITARDMSFKVFLDLVFNFLKAKRLDITIKITHNSGKSSVHSVTVEGGNFNNDDTEEEGEDNVGS